MSTFENCSISYNGENGTYKTKYGGGAYIISATELTKCTVSHNKATNGGGLYMGSDNGILKNGCNVENNTATNGGGIYYKNGGFEGTNYVYSNIATNGGGVYVDVTEPDKPNKLKGLVIGSDVATANEDKGNRAQYGGGIYANVGGNLTLKINDCKIVYNKWQSHDTGAHIDIIKGGGLYMSESYNYTVDLKGGTIIEYNEAKDGGGVYVSDIESGNLGDKNLILQLSNASLSYNKATTGHGGGIYNDKKVVQSADTLITLNGNKALAGNGGGIYNDGTCTLNNCQIGLSGDGNGNSAQNGGGLYNDGTTEFNAGKTTFENNNATNAGGGLYNNWQVTQAVACTLTFDNNTATRNGGGVYHTCATDAGSTIKLTLNGATFSGNHADENGGGIYTDHTCILNGCHIGQSGNSNGNSAKNGGGIYKREAQMLTINGGEVSNNTASNNGGGIYLEKNVAEVNNNCHIEGNKATNDGGGIYLNGQHGFEPGLYYFYSCAILKNDGITEVTTIDPSRLWVTGNGVTLIFYGTVGDDGLHIQSAGEINSLVIICEIEQTDEIVADMVNGDYFWLRLRKQNSNVFAEVKCMVQSYDDDGSVLYGPCYYFNSEDSPTPVQVENYGVPAISSTITLNGCTVGGAGKGNEATKGDGGGIYISKTPRPS